MGSPNVHEFTQDNWQSEVVSSEVPVVVDFWAPWCGPCRQLTPIVDRLADRFAGKVKIGKLNVDENGDIAATYGVSSIPRILIFKGGPTPIQSVVGLRGEADLASLIESSI